MHPDTKLVVGGRRKEWLRGMVNVPVSRTSTVLFESIEDMHAAYPPDDGKLSYGRNGTLDPMVARRSPDGARAGRRRNAPVPFGLRRRFDCADERAVARRRAADGRQHLRSDAAVLRPRAEAARR